jgi:hypothetical protein
VASADRLCPKVEKGERKRGVGSVPWHRSYGYGYHAVAEIGNCTRNHGTRSPKTAGMTIPVQNPIHLMFVVNLLHEFELGVWKAIFTHLMRILYAAAGDCIQTLNKRYVSLHIHTVHITYTDAQLRISSRCVVFVPLAHVN